MFIHSATMKCVREPPDPPPNILPDADHVRTLLIKPGNAFGESADGFPGGRELPAGFYEMTRKADAPFGPADEGPVRVLFHLQLVEGPVNHPDGFPQFPAGGRNDHPVVHEAGVKHIQPLYPVVQRPEIQGTHQG